MSSLKIIATSSLCFIIIIIIAIVAIVIVTTNVTPATTTTETPTTTTDTPTTKAPNNSTAFSQLGPSMARMIRNGGLKISEASRSIIEKKFEESRELGAKDKEKIKRLTSDRRTPTEKIMLGIGEPMDINFATALTRKFKYIINYKLFISTKL